MIPSTSAVNGLPPSPQALKQDGAPVNTQMYDQLGELARFIDTTLKTLTQFKDPMSATTARGHMFEAERKSSVARSRRAGLKLIVM